MHPALPAIFFGETPSVPRVAPLRFDTFETELTGVTKDERAIFLIEMLIELQSRRGSRGWLRDYFPARLGAAPIAPEYFNEENTYPSSRLWSLGNGGLCSDYSNPNYPAIGSGENRHDAAAPICPGLCQQGCDQ